MGVVSSDKARRTTNGSSPGPAKLVGPGPTKLVGPGPTKLVGPGPTSFVGTLVLLPEDC